MELREIAIEPLVGFPEHVRILVDHRLHNRKFADEIDEAWLEGVSTVGVTSGASVPEILVDGVLEWLAARGWGDVEQVRTSEEHLQFSLPKELRRDLRAEAAGK